MNRWLRRCGIQLMLYPAHEYLCFEAGIPYVAAVHDIQHRIQPEFPEVSADGQWAEREYYLGNTIRYATLVVADSEVGKEDILACYESHGITADRIKVLPYLPCFHSAPDMAPPEPERIRQSHCLPERYLFYPAQFWPHKNHVRVVQALGLVNRQPELEVDIVLCGANKGEFRDKVFSEAMALAEQLQIRHRIHYLGYVSDQEMPYLYAGAAGLIMPTFFGPTNIPPLEAWALGCPVITSDIRGIREQMGNAAILVDPRSVESIADGIAAVWTDPALCRELIARGKTRFAAYTYADYRVRLQEIVEEAKDRVRSARTPRTALASIRP